MNRTEDATDDKAQDDEAAQSDTSKQKNNAAVEGKLSSAGIIEETTKGAEEPSSEDNPQDVPPAAGATQGDGKDEVEENKVVAKGSTPRRDAENKKTGKEEKNVTESSQGEDVLVSVVPATDEDLNGECRAGTLENCYAPKAFTWSCLGKLFSSKDVLTIKEKFSEDRIKLWQLLHHGIEYSQSQLGISPVVMASYAERILTLMREKYYARYSQEDLKSYVPEIPRQPYTLPEECIMLPIIRGSKGTGDEIGRVSHVFIEDKPTRSNTEERSPESGKEKNKGTKRKNILVHESSEEENLPDGENSPKGPKSSKKVKPSEIRKKGKKQKRISNARLVELLKKRLEDNDSVEKVKEELISARKRIKELEEQNKVNSFVMRAHSERLYSEYCFQFDVIWHAAFRRCRPDDEESLEDFIRDYLSNKSPHHHVQGGYVLITSPEITFDTTIPKIKDAILYQKRLRDSLGGDVVDLSRAHIDMVPRTKADEGEIIDLMMGPERYVHFLSNESLQSKEPHIVPLGEVKAKISSYSKNENNRDGPMRINLRKYFPFSDDEEDTEDVSDSAHP